MKVFIHRGGKTTGPYTLDQFNEYYQAGTFIDSDLACYDGKNWVKLT